MDRRQCIGIDFHIISASNSSKLDHSAIVHLGSSISVTNPFFQVVSGLLQIRRVGSPTPRPLGRLSAEESRVRNRE